MNKNWAAGVCTPKNYLFRLLFCTISFPHSTRNLFFISSTSSPKIAKIFPLVPFPALALGSNVIVFSWGRGQWIEGFGQSFHLFASRLKTHSLVRDYIQSGFFTSFNPCFSSVHQPHGKYPGLCWLCWDFCGCLFIKTKSCAWNMNILTKPNNQVTRQELFPNLHLFPPLSKHGLPFSLSIINLPSWDYTLVILWYFSSLFHCFIEVWYSFLQALLLSSELHLYLETSSQLFPQHLEEGLATFLKIILFNYKECTKFIFSQSPQAWK